MQLYDQGRIELDADIKNYLPDGFLAKLKYDEPVTMLHLMNHTAGFQEIVYTPETENPGQIITLEHALRQFQPAQIYAPGEVCSYSNWGAALAGYIVEHISGQPFHEYVAHNIFSVLEMSRTAILPDWSDNPWVQEQRKLLHSYAISTESYEALGPSISYILLYPAGSAAGTLSDFIEFAKAFVPREGEISPLFKHRETLEFFLSPSLYYTGAEIARVCHGLWLLPYGNGVIGHSGNTKACTSGFYFDPASNTGVVVMTNKVGETAYNYGLLSVVFGEYALKPDTFSPTADISGIYTSSRAVIERGFGKVYKYIGAMLPLIKTDEPAIYAVAIGQGKVYQIADNTFISDNENGLLSLMVRSVSVDGTVRFETFTQDLFLENSLLFFTRIFFLLLFVVAVLYAVIMLLINSVGAGTKLISKKKVDISRLNILRICTYLAMSASGVLVYLIVLSEVSLYSTTAIQCISLSVLSFFPCIYGLTYWKHLISRNKGKGLSCAITSIMSLIILCNIVYWQWFNFWSY